ncbi:MAG: hypothetical protein UY21_C0001G0048 [Microgenomates group bacterium GW2011_GWA1_48_10]|nr:MAG: hypothetical protein UY21_C0001G0048 [Microgenomates group bacterium GW2011_GWA1_48_10]
MNIAPNLRHGVLMMITDFVKQLKVFNQIGGIELLNFMNAFMNVISKQVKFQSVLENFDQILC